MFYTLVVPVFEEVKVGEQVFGEELLSVGSGPKVRVSRRVRARQALVLLNPSLSFTNLYHWYYDLLH
jgi:hypothetical protein